MIGFRYSLTGAKGRAEWHEAFSRFGDEIDDFSGAFETIVEDFKKMEVRQFASEGASGSGGWRPLSKGYVDWKESIRPGRPILVFDGDLRRAATNPKTRIQPTKLEIEITDDTVGWHQFGTDRMAARPVVQLSAADIVRWRKIFHSYMVYATRRPWGFKP